jgi:hypothetical protein
VALQLGPLKFPWFGKDSHKNDPYWDFFINTAPADLANTVIEMIRKAPDGSVFPTKAELHTPEITSSHVKGMAEYFGAELVGIAKLDLFRLPAGEGKSEGDMARLIPLRSSAPSMPITIHALPPASAVKYRCRTDCLSPLF